MKILFYINVLSGGGAERVVANLASYMAEDNEVTVINSFKVDNEYPVSVKVKQIYIDHNRYSSRLKKNVYRIKFLRAWIKANKPDVCLSFMAEPNFRLLLATKGLNTKKIISVRNDPNQEYGSRLSKLLVRLLFNSADGCVFQTDDARKWFSSKLQQKSSTIINSVNPLFFDIEYEGERKNIVTCGRLSEQKNHKSLIDAFDSLKDDIDDNLLIYGVGKLKDSLQQYIDEKNLSNRVFLMGNTNDVANAIKSAKMFVLSSNFEGMPNALMEAMALGLPVISTDCPCGGPKMLIDDGVDGILVPVGERSVMETAIRNVCMNDELSASLGKNAKEKAIKYFNPNTINQQWENYVKRICEE